MESNPFAVVVPDTDFVPDPVPMDIPLPVPDPVPDPDPDPTVVPVPVAVSLNTYVCPPTKDPADKLNGNKIVFEVLVNSLVGAERAVIFIDSPRTVSTVQVPLNAPKDVISQFNDNFFDGLKRVNILVILT